MDRNRMMLHRLPGKILPLNYCLRLRPCFETFKKFEANLEVRIKVLEPCTEILMHCVKLNLKECEFKTSDGKTMKAEKILYDEENETVKLIFNSKATLSTGSGTLTIKYDGMICDKELKGIYCNRWNDLGRDLKDKCWLMTKLDRCQARMVLPCWDEPQFKACFKLEMELPTDMDCLFNTKKEKEEATTGGMKKCCFKETPMMSTSGLAFFCGKFDRAMEKDCRSGVKMRICIPKFDSDQIQGQKKKRLDWTLDICCKVMDFFAQNFAQTKFPLDKLDLLAVPNCAIFGTGCLGLMTLREDWCWINDDMSPRSKKMEAALLISRFIARQWIGNMITVKDLKEIWFEESLCRYLEYCAVDKLFPEWKIWDRKFPSEELMRAMKFDALPTTDPMEISDEAMKMWIGTQKAPGDREEHTKSGDWDFLEKFVRFSKGCVILKMITEFCGEQCFNKALCNFFSKCCFKPDTRSDDFWSELELECKNQKPNLAIRQMMKTWSEKRAYPLIHVVGKVDPANGNFVITLKQESVLNHLKKESFGKIEMHHGVQSREEPALWCIPLAITTDPNGTQPKMDILMDKEVLQLMLPAAEYRNSNGYFKLDPRKCCYGTIFYPEEHLRKIMMPRIEKREMRDPMDRFGLLWDVFQCTKLGLYSSDLFLELVKCLVKANEDSYPVWRCIFECLWEMRKCCKDSDFFRWSEAKDQKMCEKLDKFCQKLIEDCKSKMDDRFWLEALGSKTRTRADDRKAEEDMLLGLLAYFGVIFRDRELEKKAVDTFWSWFRHEPEGEGKLVPGEMQWACFTAAAQTNDPKVADAFIKIYKDYKFEEAREYALHGMGFFTEPRIVERLLEMALKCDKDKQDRDCKMASEDTLRMCRSMMRRFPETRDMMWKMMKGKMDFFVRNYDCCRLASDFFEEFITEIADDKLAEEVCRMVRDKITPTKSCTRMLQLSMECAQLKREWFKRDSETIRRYLDKF